MFFLKWERKTAADQNKPSSLAASERVQRYRGTFTRTVKQTSSYWLQHGREEELEKSGARTGLHPSCCIVHQEEREKVSYDGGAQGTEQVHPAGL